MSDKVAHDAKYHTINKPQDPTYMKTGCHLDKGHKCIRQNVQVSADLAVRAESKKDNVIIEGLLKGNIE